MYKTADDCPYTEATEDMRCAWADGWNQSFQKQLQEAAEIKPATFETKRFYMAVNSVRVARGLSWFQVTDVSGVSSTWWTLLATMKTPELAVREKMAEWANLRLEDFDIPQAGTAKPLPRQDYEAVGRVIKLEPADKRSANVLSAMEAYLRVCRSGGMPGSVSDQISRAVAEAQRRGYFAALQAQEWKPIEPKASHE